MVDRTKGDKRVGVMACLCCAREIPVKIKASGKLAAPCPWCDLPLYANEHTEAFKRLYGLVKLDQDPADPPAADPAPAASASSAPAPAAATRRAPLFGGR